MSNFFELLDNRIIHHMIWIDTRDMMADGLTKGAVSREAIHEVMDGHMLLRHEHKRWHSKRALVAESSAGTDLYTLSFFSLAFDAQDKHSLQYFHSFLSHQAFATEMQRHGPLGGPLAKGKGKGAP